MGSENRSASVNPGLTRPLAEIASEINQHHSEAVGHFRRSLEHARQTGELLKLAKAQILHGSWSAWLADNTTVSKRMAQKYLQVADNWDKMIKNAPEAHLTIDQAIRRIKPKAPPKALLPAPKHSPDALTTERLPAPQSRPNQHCDSNFPPSANNDFAESMARLVKEDLGAFAREVRQTFDEYFRQCLGIETYFPIPADDRRAAERADSIQQVVRLAKEMREMEWLSDAFWSRYATLNALREHVATTYLAKK